MIIKRCSNRSQYSKIKSELKAITIPSSKIDNRLLLCNILCDTQTGRRLGCMFFKEENVFNTRPCGCPNKAELVISNLISIKELEDMFGYESVW